MLSNRGTADHPHLRPSVQRSFAVADLPTAQFNTITHPLIIGKYKGDGMQRFAKTSWGVAELITDSNTYRWRAAQLTSRNAGLYTGRALYIPNEQENP